MIPLRDLVPSRTAPGVTLVLVAAQASALAFPALRGWWPVWVVNILTIWICGSTLEDRMGHGRFAVFVALCGGLAAGAAAPASLSGEGLLAMTTPSGAVAGVAAGYLRLFPRARVLALVPVVVGLECIDLPAWVVAGLWIVVHGAAATSALSAGSASVLATAWLAGALGGGAAVRAFLRPERMKVDWWDLPPA